MDFYRIECFLAAAETGSMTKAAEKMCVTQPSMSFQIRELERELQIPLFERDYRGIRLTEAGRILQTGFARILDSYRKLVDNALACAYGKLRLTIGFHGFINWAGVHSFIADFSDRHPEIDVIVMQQQWKELADYLEVGALDIAFLETSELEGRDRLAAFELFREQTCFALRQSHPLAKCERITADQLAGETVLMNNHSSTSMNALIQNLYDSGIGKEQFRFFEQLDVALAMAATGQGLTSIPLSFVQRDLDLAYVEYDSPFCHMSYSLAWNASTVNPAVKLFCEESSHVIWPYHT